ncbi:MAG TPA: hypothetical protein VGJ15_11725 [Pirellulales bacterium]|jgi:hypothetical protein
MQTTTNGKPGNRVKLDQIEATLAEMLAETLRRGFFGKASLELAIQDGVIQNIRRFVEKIEK